MASIYIKEREQFEAWLSTKCSEKTRFDYLSALDKFLEDFKTIETPAQLRILTANESKHLVLALRNFVKYLKEQNIIDTQTALEYLDVLKVKKSGIREVYLNDDEVREAYKAIKKRGKSAEALFLLLLFSGARLSAIKYMIQNYNKRQLTPINDKYARYSLLLERNTKKAHYIYAPIWVFTLLEENLKKLKQYAYNTLAKKTTYKRVSANSLRKYFFTKALETGAAESIVDFIQGRDIQRVGSKVYLDKLKLADEFYPKIAEKLGSVVHI